MREFFNRSKKVSLFAVCAAELFVMSACAAENNRPTEQITIEKAEEVALSDAGLSETDVTSIKTKPDTENGISVYNIEFYAKDTKYEYEVQIDTGKIYSRSKEILGSQESIPNETIQNIDLPEETQTDSDLLSETQQNAIQQSTAKQNEVQQNTIQQNEVQQDTIQQNAAQQEKEQIDLNAAKDMALKDAGLTSSEVVYTKEKLEYEDGIAVYDIEFYTDAAEYEYEINATTGAVVSRDVDVHHAKIGEGGHHQASGTYIGEDSAKSIALNHAGFSAVDVTHLKSKFDIEDGQAVYEVEFYKDGREYDYTLNASDGTIIEYDID